MNRVTAQTLARNLMDEHGLSWVEFKFDRAKTRLGATHFLGNLPHKITLSALYVDLLPEDEIRDVILHEIAHAIAGHSAGHGPTWRRIALSIGCNGMRCATPTARPEAALVGTCPNGHTTEAHRHPQRVKACAHRDCRRLHALDRVFVWRKNGKVALAPARYRQELERAQLIRNRGGIVRG